MCPTVAETPTRTITIRPLVRGAYDIQKLRIETGNRLVANFKVVLGQAPGKSEDEELDESAKALLAELRATYKKIAETVAAHPRAPFRGEGVIATYTQYALVGQYLDLERVEKEHFARLEKVLQDYPIWMDYLSGIRGIGPAMAAVLISEIDIAKARTPSSLWKYAGLDVVVNDDGVGEGRSRKAHHLIDVTYMNRRHEETTRKSITFNPWLKTKLFVLATSFMKSGGPYKDIYDGYKHRLECHPLHAQKTKGHRHSMAMRHMIKLFLVDLYKTWRAMEGLPVSPPYAEAKLGIVHHA